MAPSRRSRTLGALLAVHAGDALGAPFEFKPYTAIRSRHPGPNSAFPRTLTGGGFLSWAPGAATDDTDLTRAVLLAYRDAILSGDDVISKAAEHSLAWYRGDRWPGRRQGTLPRDIGGATRRGLSSFASSRDPSSSGAGQGSAGNGSLMRCIPTGLFQADPELLVKESQCISAITHNDRRCTIACAAYNTIVSALVVRGLSVEDAVSASERVAVSLEGGRPDGPVHAAIKIGRTISLEDLADKGPRGVDFLGSCSGFVLDSLTLAVAAVLDERRLDQVLVDVVRVGRDTDTNAAIAGGLLGARDGEEAVLDEWKDLLQFGPEFRRLADQLLTAQGVLPGEGVGQGEGQTLSLYSLMT
ncbi:Pc21g23880 [Penicillium rubens Wisconsin 54-1255]|uniref:ADP-ribosylhydrolase ARH3 n=1 Tax=Penicillium rubens (strain ATCC 28089 / DSM 1075 / NRRL 1951 / Wisconsin 54-1255) TaxID=500485 RepID=B6HJ73_PENRW|nr:Pc21g23880 [Penicillium rubens Wisconsin 54-1255]